jgi:hypothetical protein
MPLSNILPLLVLDQVHRLLVPCGLVEYRNFSCVMMNRPQVSKPQQCMLAVIFCPPGIARKQIGPVWAAK